MKKELPKIDLKKIYADPRVFVVLISIVCIALIVVCVYTLKQTTATEASIAASVQEFNDNKAAIENLLALKERADIYEKQNEKYEKLITSEGFDQQKFMIDFDALCNDYNCRMTLITFQEQYDFGGVKNLPIQLTVSGKYNDIMSLCDAIITQDRFYRIDGLKINSTSDQKVATIELVAVSK